MPGSLTEITEITTALGTLAPDIEFAMRTRPERLVNVTDEVWERLVEAFRMEANVTTFATAFENGVAFLRADDGLRRRPPRLVEWKGHHKVPGDDVVPADIRIDHVYQVSCKYLSKITQNCGPSRLFDRLLVGERRTNEDWFATVAPDEYQSFYEQIRDHLDLALPERVDLLTPRDRAALKGPLSGRSLPSASQVAWASLCVAVSTESARRWNAALATPTSRLRTLWRLLRIGDAPYFVLGADGRSHVRLRVASAWDWTQRFDLRSFSVARRQAGQPEVGWSAAVTERESKRVVEISGHVEVRWSHGRLQGAPEAKVYLDTPFTSVPGYFQLE